MAMQSAIAVGLSVLCAILAAPATYRCFLGRWGWFMANALVVLGATLSLLFARDWAGWLAAGLFALLVGCPFALLVGARRAAQRGQWGKVARLQGWAILFHPTPWARFGLTLSRARSLDPQHGYQSALARIEATGSQKQMVFARLLLAQERRDWDAVLSLARGGNVEFSEATSREIRALGELGRLEAMVHAYARAERWLTLEKRRECMLFVCAFTGRLSCVEHLLSRPPAADDEVKTFWVAVARLRADRADKIARSTLQGLAEAGVEARVRRSAAQELARANRAGAPIPLALGTQRLLDQLVQGVSQGRSRRQTPWQRLKWSSKVHLRGLLLLILVILIAAVQRCSR